MDIRLHETGKRYRQDWIFRNLTFHFQAGTSYAIAGPNGSGKSTLLKIISGHLTPSRGKVEFFRKDKKTDTADAYRYISFAAPYIDLIEEFTLSEAIDFHQNFKSFQTGLSKSGLLEMLGLKKATHKEISAFSSGMKQRLKLALALCTDTPIVLLDEPTTNLDAQGVGWYRTLIQKFGAKRLLIVASNVREDFDFCQQSLNVTNWKSK